MSVIRSLKRPATLVSYTNFAFLARILELVTLATRYNGGDGATYFSCLDDGVAVYEEDVNTAEGPTPLRPGYGGNVGSPDEIRYVPHPAPFVTLDGEILGRWVFAMDVTRGRLALRKAPGLGT